MISLRNIPFYFVALTCLALGLAFPKDSPWIWYSFAAVFLIAAIAFRKEIDTADSEGH